MDAAKRAPESWDVVVDVAIVGGGAAGCMVAATLAALDSTSSIAILEKGTRHLCNAEIGSGTLFAAGTRYQAAEGVQDSSELFTADITAKAKGQNDATITERLTQGSADVVHWLADKIGIPIEFEAEARRVGHSRPRAHGHPSRSGKPLIADLRRWLGARPNVWFADDLPAIGIDSHEGSVIGLRAGSSERPEMVRARYVVLAAGGFAANPRMVQEYLPELADATYVGASGHTGDAIRWAMELGAAVDHMHGHQGHGYVVKGYGTRINPGIILGGAIMVNSHGRRFDHEDQGYSEWAGVVMAQPDHTAVAIWDESIHAPFVHSQTVLECERAGALFRTNELDAVANHFRLPKESLRQTLREYHAGVQAGQDALGRHLPVPLLEPPYIAAKVTGGLAQTLGGIRVDQFGHVLRHDGSWIKGLFAAGTCTAGISGDSADGYLSGEGLLAAFGLGRIVGRQLHACLSGADRGPTVDEQVEAAE